MEAIAIDLADLVKCAMMLCDSSLNKDVLLLLLYGNVSAFLLYRTIQCKTSRNIAEVHPERIVGLVIGELINKDDICEGNCMASQNNFVPCSTNSK